MFFSLFTSWKWKEAKEKKNIINWFIISISCNLSINSLTIFFIFFSKKKKVFFLSFRLENVRTQMVHNTLWNIIIVRNKFFNRSASMFFHSIDFFPLYSTMLIKTEKIIDEWFVCCFFFLCCSICNVNV